MCRSRLTAFAANLQAFRKAAGSHRCGLRFVQIRKPTQQRQIRGLTLVELMVVIVIIAIMATIGMPAFQDLIRDNRTSAHAREMGSLMAFARSEALRRNGNVEVVIALDRADVCLVQPCGEATAVRSMEFERVSVSASDPNPPLALAFTNRGYVDPFSAIEFQINHDGCANRPRQSRTLRLERTGQLTVSVGGGCS